MYCLLNLLVSFFLIDYSCLLNGEWWIMIKIFFFLPSNCNTFFFLAVLWCVVLIELFHTITTQWVNFFWWVHIELIFFKPVFILYWLTSLSIIPLIVLQNQKKFQNEMLRNFEAKLIWNIIIWEKLHRFLWQESHKYTQADLVHLRLRSDSSKSAQCEPINS